MQGRPSPEHRRARELDQFFTRPDVAASLVARLHRVMAGEGRDAPWIEPSAGAGAFLDSMPDGATGLDIAPARPGIREADFLAWRPDTEAVPAVVVGNPPFGKNSSTAVRFFNHAAGFAGWIAFVLPRTFQKASLQRRLHPSFHLVYEHVLEPSSFVFQGRPYDVPTVFQVWRKRPQERPVCRVAIGHPDFEFVSAAHATFAFQRVGVRAGLVSVDGLRKSRQSHYFIRPLTDRTDVSAVLSAIDWNPAKERTAGNPSIGKAELVAAYAAAVCCSSLRAA